MEDVGGWRFVVGVLASVVAIGIGLLLVFAVFDRAAMAWGLFGAFTVFVLLLLGFAWFYDKRQVRTTPTESRPDPDRSVRAPRQRRVRRDPDGQHRRCGSTTSR